MISNSTNATNAGVARGYTADEEQIAFDQLDPCLRWFIANAPEKLSCVWVLSQQTKIGATKMIEGGLAMVRQRYPDFKWPNGAPW
jgi:hypothetical protein